MITAPTFTSTPAGPMARQLARAICDRGELVWIDADKWNSGATVLQAYKPNGERRTVRGSFGRESLIYHRARLTPQESTQTMPRRATARN